MKFFRHLLAATAIVAVATGLGVLWGHSSLKSLVTDGGGFRDRAPASVISGSTTTQSNVPQFRDRKFDGRDGGGASSRLQDIGQSVATEGALIAGVVIVDKRFKKGRRAKRIPITH